jgi:hypothetical protein
MTAIAWKGNEIAADSHTVSDDDSVKYPTLKLERVGSYVFGMAGERCPSNLTIRNYLFAGRKLRKRLKAMDDLDFSVLIAGPEGAYLADSTGDMEKLTAPFWAIGSGAASCMAAMEMGADAELAVRIAIKWAPKCEGPVRVETLNG